MSSTLYRRHVAASRNSHLQMNAQRRLETIPACTGTSWRINKQKRCFSEKELYKKSLESEVPVGFVDANAEEMSFHAYLRLIIAF
jgi:hypothetical protein